VIHLAGVNRPTDEREFVTGNVELTRAVADGLRAAGRGAPLVIASSTRAADDTPYGASKRAAEEAVREYGARSGAPVAVFRLPNVFGKWSRPFYNSAVATFCHSIARDLPFDVHDETTKLQLVYGEDVAHALIAQARGTAARPAAGELATVEPVYERTLGQIVALLQQFRALRTELVLPDFSDTFVRKLYTTYVSFLPVEEVSYALHQHTDDRGALAELLKSPWFGQVFVSRTKPGITRGNHFHHTKTEKFVVVEGEAVIRMRPSEGGPVTEIPVRGSDFRVVDIPPGCTHSITNVGTTDLVTLFWSSEIFDRARPDTYMLPVVDA
jgi:UDP-2-acetamido-2,6-beta-L-arabino-hexul-4-ose reductase